MRILRLALLAALTVGMVYAVGRFFASELGAPSAAGEPTAVPLSAPPGYRVVEAGELSRRAAADGFATLLMSEVGQRAAYHFASAGSEIYWFVDRGRGGEPSLVERRASPTGTRLETVYAGDPAARLKWAAAHDSLVVPGMPEGESRNLYH